MSDWTSSRPSNTVSTPFPIPDGRTTTGGIGGAGWDDENYDDVLDLDGCYFVYVCVRDTSRARDLEARKEAEQRRKKRMVTVTLLQFSGHRALETGGGGGILTVALG